MGASQNWGYLFLGPHIKDEIILGSILGSPYFGKLPGGFRVLSHPDSPFCPLAHRDPVEVPIILGFYRG